MVLKSSVRASVLALMLGLGASFGPQLVQAQEYTDAHLKAARSAIAVLGATDQFDGIILQAANALKAELIQKDPNLQDVIIATVDDTTIKLVGRRSDLEQESARIYATAFTEDELNAIAAFYDTEAGKKLIKEGPIVTRQLIRAAQIWQQGIARDLAQTAGAELSKIAATAEEEAPAATEEAPAAE